jgi:hypothetical protein
MRVALSGGYNFKPSVLLARRAGLCLVIQRRVLSPTPNTQTKRLPFFDYTRLRTQQHHIWRPCPDT